MRREGRPLPPRFVKFKSKLRKTTNVNLTVCMSLPSDRCILYPFIVAGECNAAPGIEDAAAIAGNMIALHGDILDADGR